MPCSTPVSMDQSALSTKPQHGTSDSNISQWRCLCCANTPFNNLHRSGSIMLTARMFFAVSITHDGISVVIMASLVPPFKSSNCESRTAGFSLHKRQHSLQLDECTLYPFK